MSRTDQAPGPLPQRVNALDGVRGLAALVVVVFHVMMLTPALASVARGDAAPAGWLAILNVPPLKLLWSGDEAVIVFFVLSGYVLTLPYLRRQLRVRAYYPSRFIRLFVPTWASIILALAWFYLVPRATIPRASWWLNSHDRPISLRSLRGDASLVIGTSWTNSVL